MSADYEAPSEQDLNVCSHSRESRRRPVRRQGASSDGGERPQTPGSVLRRRGASSGGGERPQTAGSVLRRRGASSGGGERPQTAGSVLRRQGASSDGSPQAAGSVLRRGARAVVPRVQPGRGDAAAGGRLAVRSLTGRAVIISMAPVVEYLKPAVLQIEHRFPASDETTGFKSFQSAHFRLIHHRLRKESF
ncbi:hypothetical protein KUCAC02_032462 [Chaenocephalus aceratus]|nr:hypothetical protein KUCAC02_032462 [Chaenocephalus aceratus]